MKKYFLISLCLLAFSFTYSQTSTQTNTDKGMQFYFGIGGAYNNFKNLNNAFSNGSLPTVGKFTLNNIFEGDVRLKNLLLGLTGGMNAYAKRNDNYNTSLMSYSGGVNVGYYVFNTKKFHLAPQAGIGFYSSEIKLTQRKGFTDFNEVLTNGNSIDINQNTAALDFCLKFDFADFTKNKTCLTGIRAGYKYGLSERGWGVDITSNSTVDNSPKDRISQVYLMATIGLARLK